MKPLGKGDIWFLYETPSFPLYRSFTGLLDSFASPVEDVGVDHGGFHVFVPKEFENGPHITGIFHQLCGR